MGRVTALVVCVGAVVLPVGTRAIGQDNKEKDARVTLEIRLAEKELANGLTEMAAPRTKDKIYVHTKAAVGNADIAQARVVKNALGQPAVEVVFAKGSREKVSDFSGRNIGKVAAIFIDGKLVDAPVIRAKFSDKTEIWGAVPFTPQEAERIAKGLKHE